MRNKITIFLTLLLLISCCKSKKTIVINKKIHTILPDTTIYYEDTPNVSIDSFDGILVGSSGGGEYSQDSVSFEYLEKPTTIKKGKLSTKKNVIEKEENKNILISNDVVSPSENNNVINIGKVVYQVPDTMKIFTNYRITVRITKDNIISNNIIRENLERQNGSIKESNIQTTSKMEVIFKDESTEDDPSFLISKINNDQQIIDGNYTEWIFNVKPIKHGDKKLNLVISIIKNDNKKQIVYTDTIYVKDSLKLQIKLFWNKYWQYLMSTFIIPIFIFFWKKRKQSSEL